MKIVSWNVNGIRACAKKGFLEFIEREDPDFLCVQETKAHPEQLDLFLLSPGGRQAFWSSAARKGYSGTVTYSKESPKSVYYGINVKKFDSEGRFVVTEHDGFALYNVYFPNGSAREERHLYKQDFLERFRKHLEKRIKKGDQLIVVGDYNVAHKEIDVFDPKRLATVSGFLPEEREWFDKFLATGFCDTYRYMNPNEKEVYTWWSYRENARIANRGWRIDYICVTDGLVDKIKNVSILTKQTGSDHCPVVLELEGL